MSDSPAVAEYTPTAREVFARFWPLARQDRGLMVAVGLCSAVAVACEVAVVLLFVRLTDQVLETANFHAFWPVAVTWLAVAAAGGLATFGSNVLTSFITERFLLRIRDAVFGHVQKLSPDFFTARDSGDLTSRVTSDIDAVEGLVASGPVHLAVTILTALSFAVAALWIRWELAVAAFAVAPLFLLVSRRFTNPFARASRRERDTNGVVTSVVAENLANMMLVQAYNQRHVEQARLHRAGKSWLSARLTEARLAAVYGPVVELTETLCLLTVLGLGAWELSVHRITLAGLLGFATFLGMLYPPLQRIGSLGVVIASASGGAARLVEILDTPPAVADTAQTGLFSIERGRVTFDRVTFGYPGQERKALREVSFDAEPGGLIVVTGGSGAGKSTLSRLLLRFHDPAYGTIRLDGVDIRKLTLRRLRAEVTLLPQQTMLFDGTVRENIAYGRPDATDAQIEAAARAADAHTFIGHLPQGFETEVGQGGHSLSGGQRQRIAIARAMLRDSPVLVLDEPTTGLDAVTAQHVTEPLRRLMSGRTTIMITHDLRLAPDADQILVLDDGQLVGGGRHGELLMTSPRYRRLWEAQLTSPEPRLPLTA